MNVALTVEQVELVRSLIRREWDELRSEIYHTESTDYKRDLKRREQVLMELAQIFGVTEIVPSPVS